MACVCHLFQNEHGRFHYYRVLTSFTGNQGFFVISFESALSKTLESKGKEGLHDIWQPDTRKHAENAFDLFLETYEAKYPKATRYLEKDREELLAFYDFPAHTLDLTISPKRS